MFFKLLFHSMKYFRIKQIETTLWNGGQTNFSQSCMSVSLATNKYIIPNIVCFSKQKLYGTLTALYI